MRVIGIAGASLVLLGLVGCNQESTSKPEALKPPVAVPVVKAPEAPPIVPKPPVPLVPAVPDDRKAEARIRAMIPGKEALSKKLWDAAMAAGGHSHVGTMFNEIDVNQHSCFILGNLLNRRSQVEHLIISYDVDLASINEDNAHEHQVMTVSLDNFVGVANGLLNLSRDERVLQWNLDCVGKLDIPRTAFVEQKGTSTFYQVKNDGKVLQILGDIEAGFAQKMIDAIEANPGVETVALGSGGGYIYEAFKAGLYIRRNGLGTVLWNGCYSACPLVFMGGDQRDNWSPYPVLGFHQISDQEGSPVPLDSKVYKDVVSYLISMDIEPRYVIQKMWSASPQQMTEIDGRDEELCKANIITWAQRGCTSRSYKSQN